MYSRNLLIEKLQLAILDGLVVFGCALVATWLRHGVGILSPDGASGVPWSAYLFPSVLVASGYVILLRLQGLYAGFPRPLEEAFRIARAASVATMAVLTLTFFYRGYSYSRATVLLFYPLSIVCLVASRWAYRRYRRAVLAHRDTARRVLIVGFGRVGQHLGRALLDNPSYYTLVGFLDDDLFTSGRSLDRVPVLGATQDLERVTRERRIDEVMVAIPSAPQDRMMDLIGECMRLRVRWKVVPNLCDLMLERVHLDHVGGLPLIGLRGSRVLGFNWAMKRAFDLTVSAAALLVLAPLLAVIASAIKLTSRGPVLFKQARVGLHGRVFTFLKFRSMKAHSGTEIHKHFTADWIYGRTGSAGSPDGGEGTRASNGRQVVHKIRRDPRVTPVGWLLRRTSLDELPQLWNVLRGEMSIVGPRPPLPYEVERYTEWHKRRLEVLPGLTGLWQVSGRNSLSFEEMVRLDIDYIEKWSLEEDFRILLRTVPAVLFGRAY